VACRRTPSDAACVGGPGGALPAQERARSRLMIRLQPQLRRLAVSGGLLAATLLAAASYPGKSLAGIGLTTAIDAGEPGELELAATHFVPGLPAALANAVALHFGVQGRGELLADAVGGDAAGETAAELGSISGSAAAVVSVVPRLELSVRFTAERVAFEVDGLQATLPVAELAAGTEPGTTIIPEARAAFEIAPSVRVWSTLGLGRDADAYTYGIEIEVGGW
jgi:hypothetical protein